MRRVLMIIALTIGAAAGPARAAQAPCWYENGALVVSASIGDIAGDFILDLSAPHSLLHLTRAQSDGFDGTDFVGDLRLAGEPMGKRHFAVVDLDARNMGFPTEISGTIGADVLDGHVLDLRLKPCRIGVWRLRAPAFHARRRLAVRTTGGVATVTASAFDGADTRSGQFSIDTGSAGVRVAGHAAMLTRTPRGINASSRTRPPARLRGLILAGATLQDVPAGLERSAPPERLGAIGTAVWERYAIRLDLGRGVLELKRAR